MSCAAFQWSSRSGSSTDPLNPVLFWPHLSWYTPRRALCSRSKNLLVSSLRDVWLSSTRVKPFFFCPVPDLVELCQTTSLLCRTCYCFAGQTGQRCFTGHLVKGSEGYIKSGTLLSYSSAFPSFFSQRNLSPSVLSYCYYCYCLIFKYFITVVSTLGLVPGGGWPRNQNKNKNKDDSWTW